MTPKLTYSFFLFLSFFAISCNGLLEQNPTAGVPLTLKKSTFSGVDEIDTIEAIPAKGLYFFQLTRRGHLGNYTITYGFEKNKENNTSDKLRYEADYIGLRSLPAEKESWFWYSKEHLLLMDRNLTDHGQGWFRMKNGRMLGWDIIGELSHGIVDSLRKLHDGTYKIVMDSMLTIYRNDTLVYTMPSDTLTARYDESKFESLQYGLYKRINDSLLFVSKEPNDIFKREDGIFFIPFPGYGLRNRYAKAEIFRQIDSVSKTASPPKTLIVKPVK